MRRAGKWFIARPRRKGINHRDTETRLVELYLFKPCLCVSVVKLCPHEPATRRDYLPVPPATGSTSMSAS